MKRRDWMHWPLAALALTSCLVFAQDTRTVRIVVPFPAGGATDAIARLIGQKMAQDSGQPVVVDNRTGASGQIGTAHVKAAKPDGLTYLFTPDHTIVTLPVLMDNPGFDPLKDFTAVGQVARFQLAVTTAAPQGPATLAQFQGVARSTPALASVGVPVVGGYPSSVVVALQKSIGVPLTGVPYRGSGPVAADVAGGQVGAGVTGLADVMPMVKGGRLQVLAVTGKRRSSWLPATPTLEEIGVPGLTVDSWYAFFAPAGLPQATAQRFNQALNKALADPEVKRKIAELSIELAPTSLKEADEELRSAAQYWINASKQPDFVRP